MLRYFILSRLKVAIFYPLEIKGCEISSSRDWSCEILSFENKGCEILSSRNWKLRDFILSRLKAARYRPHEIKCCEILYSRDYGLWNLVLTRLWLLGFCQGKFLFSKISAVIFSFIFSSKSKILSLNVTHSKLWNNSLIRCRAQQKIKQNIQQRTIREKLKSEWRIFPQLSQAENNVWLCSAFLFCFNFVFKERT